jgi:hypothetical protein
MPRKMMLKTRKHYSLGSQMVLNLESKMNRISKNAPSWVYRWRNYNYALLYPNVFSYKMYTNPERYVGPHTPLSVVAALQFGFTPYLATKMTFDEVIGYFERGEKF